MRNFIAIASLLLACQPSGARTLCETLSSELQRMVSVDQAVRALVSPEDMATTATREESLPRSIQRMVLVDRAHEATFVRLIRACGWPQRSKHGDKSTGAAWLLVQHARPEIQKEFLPLLAAAVERREAEGNDLAYLTDRVRIHDGQPQLYGTQLEIKGPCEFELSPIDSRELVNTRRKAIGIPPLEEYERAFRDHMASQGCEQK